MRFPQDISRDDGTSEDEDVVAMETDAIDRQSCFVLFRKFVKEVQCIRTELDWHDFLCMIRRQSCHNMFCLLCLSTLYVSLCLYGCLQVLVRMRQYKDDLLASCLQLLLSLPNELVELEFEALIPALQVCLIVNLDMVQCINVMSDVPSRDWLFKKL